MIFLRRGNRGPSVVVLQVVLDAVFPYARDHLAYPDLIEEGLEPHKVTEVW